MVLRKLFSESDFGGGSCFRFAGGYLVEIGFIIREIRSHDAIPEIEIEAVIPVKLLVMHIMMSGCVDPFGERMARPTFGKKFVAKVPPNIHHHGVESMSYEDAEMDWDQADKRHHVDRL